MSNKPTRDEVLDAFEVLIRAEARQLRPTLDSVFEAGFRDGVETMRRQQMVSGSWDSISDEPINVPVV